MLHKLESICRPLRGAGVIPKAKQPKERPEWILMSSFEDLTCLWGTWVNGGWAAMDSRHMLEAARKNPAHALSFSQTRPSHRRIGGGGETQMQSKQRTRGRTDGRTDGRTGGRTRKKVHSTKKCAWASDASGTDG